MVERNWAGNFAYSTDRIHRPTSTEELEEVVRVAEHLRPLGSRHSFNRLGDTHGALVDVRALPAEIAINADRTEVTVPAGATYGEVASALHARGLALHNLGSLPHISVAGACATGTHGSGIGNGCLATAVRAIELIDASGEIVTVRDVDPDFPGVVLALGALGVATRLTLAVEPTYDVAQDVWLDAPLANVLGAYDDIVRSGYSVSLFRQPGTRGRMDYVWIKRRAGSEPVDGTPWGARPADSDVHPIAGQDTRAATEQRGRPGPWHERLPHFRASFTPSSGDEQQSEYFVPVERGPEAIEAVLALDIDDALQVAEFRNIAADGLWLSPFRGRTTTALHFTWHNDDSAVATAVDEVEKALAPFDPRPHWAKVFRRPPEEVRGHYPALADFRRLVDRYDPGHKFGNPFLDAFVY